MTINLQNIPNEPGVYIFKDAKDQVLYIGKAKNLQKRVTQYFSPGSLRKQEMLSKAEKLDFHIVQSESEALYLEDNLIKKYQPYYNNLLKADNSYVYIKITHEYFPQILITRKRLNDKAIYIGPKHNTQVLKKFLQYLRQVLKFRGCGTAQFKQGKLCSDYYFGICKGRCTLAHDNPSVLLCKGAGTEGDGGFKKAKQEYTSIIHSITSFFKGNIKPIKDEIRNQINEASKKHNFERAAKLRDIYTEIDQLAEQQTVVLPQKTTGYLIQVKPVGQRRISVILYFYEGKLIDIIRHKEHQNDKDQDEIIADLAREFGLLYPQKTAKGELLLSTIKTLKKSTQKEINKLSENLFQSYIINSSFDESNLMNELLLTVQKRYQLKKFPYRIECIDISHLSGGRVSGGLSCLLGGIKYPHGYRRYKIKAAKGDDYEALKELLERREKNGGELPDLLILDGGKGQLGIVKNFCKERHERKKIIGKIDIIALGKGEARNKSKVGTTSKKGLVSEKIYSLDSKLAVHEQALVYDQADKILLQARDEAHRFANAYRKKQMSKEFRQK